MATTEIHKIPVTVLTGFLGAGKTTLLNRILTEKHGRRIAVIENEFGEIGVDNELVIGADEEIFEMNNGCICCTVRGDLIRILTQLTRRKDKPDMILVETTGLADPGPVAQTFWADEDMQERFTLDAIITLVDARHVLLHIDDGEECKKQIAFADVLLLNKTDLVSPAELEVLEKRIRGINSLCTLHHTQNAAIELKHIFNVEAFDLEKRVGKQAEPAGNHAHHHHHDDAVSSVGIINERPVNQARFQSWISSLLQTNGSDIFRSKGILYLEGYEDKVVFQGVHMLFTATLEGKWGKKDTRKNQLVFIGRNLKREELNRGFEQCLD